MLAAIAAASLALALPRPVRRDFDHDGRIDTAEVVPAGAGRYQLIVHRGAEGHRTVIVATFTQLRYLYLDKARPGRWRTWCGKGGDDGSAVCRRRVVRLTGDTLSFGYEEASQSVALWTGRRFETVLLSD